MATDKIIQIGGSEGISLSGWVNTHLRMRNGVRIAGNAQNAQTMMRLSIVKMPLLPLSNKKGEK